MDSNYTNSESEGITLSRTLNLFTITMIGVGGMIGAGIFVLTGIAAGVAGSALILVFFLNGLVTLFTAMTYAELGSAFPEAGGGYLWVKEGMGGIQGFLAGWMSWFAHALAGSLYALGFGRFAAELWVLAGLPTWGLSVHQLAMGLMTLIILIFTLVNYRGASETGLVGNIATMTKITILGLFILFGLVAMTHRNDLHIRFITEFMPNGVSGVLTAMGLTFIAFEGYEIIAQSGEEVVNPQRNIPRAIFLAILIAVTIYILVGFTAIGATITPNGVPVYQYLGSKQEIAIVDVAQQIFPRGSGGIILLISGLVSTMSALNATSYSSSRVSFAMGRDHNLPAFFARIHPRRYTPYLAVISSGSLMMLMAWLLPLASVAAAADIMFLLLFIQVNVAVMTLRQKMPNLARGFTIPWFPAIPIIGLVTNAILAIMLFTFSPVAWFLAIGWILVGALSYYVYFSKIEGMERPKEILHEEVLVSRHYSVVVPIADEQQARMLGLIGSILAQANQGEILALYAVRVPPQFKLSDGRLLLKESRPILETAIQQAKRLDVPVHTVVRLGRSIAEVVQKTVEENAADLIVMGWPGHTDSQGRMFGSVIDPIVDNPPSDIALVRYRERHELHSILVPVAGGPNSRRAFKMAVNMAQFADDGPALVRLLHVIPVNATESDRVRAEQVIRDVLNGMQYERIEKTIVEAETVVEAVLSEAKGFDLIIIGASQEPLFKNMLMGNIPKLIAQNAKVTVIIVKRRSGPLHSFLRKTILTPSTRLIE
jgi:amino acid transporter/nucleotide-binding universal stress UspA family protein